MSDASEYQRPALVFVNRLGDQVYALPAMRAFSHLFPAGFHLFLGEGQFGFFYRGLPILDITRVWWTDDSQEHIDIERILTSAPSCDLFVCLARIPDALALARRLGAVRTLGRDDTFDLTAPVDDFPHNFDRYFAFVQSLAPDLDIDRFSDPPTFSPAAEAAAVRTLSAFRQPGDRLLFVHPESARPEKTWPPDRWAWVLRRFLDTRPEYRVIVHSLEPLHFGLDPERVRHSDAHLELTLAMIRSMDLFAGVDSCCLHAADILRVPGVALFGPTPASLAGFRFSRPYRHISAPAVADIEPEHVLDALLDVAGATAHVAAKSALAPS